MVVIGEEYLLMNLLMDTLCLTAAMRLSSLRARPGRVLLSALAGALLSMIALSLWGLRASAYAALPIAVLMALLAYAFGAMGIAKNPDAITIGALMILVPGLLFTNAMRDIIYGDTNSGIFRLVQVVFTALAIALGTAAAWHLTSGVYGVTGSATVTWQPLAQAVAVFVGCLGFCILFNVHGRGSVLCIIGGVVTWMLYLLGGALGCDVYVANLFASLFAAAYAEVMARVRKCPAMPYLVIAILPLLPGAGVYYTMSLGLEGNRMDAVAKGLETVGIAGSLAVGILLVSTVFRLIYRHVQGARAEKS